MQVYVLALQNRYFYVVIDIFLMGFLWSTTVYFLDFRYSRSSKTHVILRICLQYPTFHQGWWSRNIVLMLLKSFSVNYHFLCVHYSFLVVRFIMLKYRIFVHTHTIISLLFWNANMSNKEIVYITPISRL